MVVVRKCPKCGFELTDATTKTCPICGTAIVGQAGGKIWIAALIQFAAAMTFMLAFGFPKVIIAIFGTLTLVVGLMSARAKSRPVSRPAPQAPIKNPILYRIVSLAILLCSFVFLCILLFGFVGFMNSWDRWHRYEGQPYHRSEFIVEQVYFQRLGKGGVDAYARGSVEGQREWMGLRPYLRFTPRSEAEVAMHVPSGTTIPIYYFPEMKGRSRVQVYEDTPPAEESHLEAVKTLNYGLVGLVVTAGIIFVLSRVLKACRGEAPPSFQQVTSETGFSRPFTD